ncbi:MAG: class I SAM-dependent methyltransferase [Chloroflexi bacterium]|nr:class I SAM-dependent methyltransferase [Chloroflexota bacterium]
MSKFQHWIYRLFYLRKPPWDTGVTPPEVTRRIESGEIPPGRALDLGCGTGTNAIYLAQHGFQVVGIDFVPRAIEQARQKAAQAGVDVAFHVGDVSDISFLGDVQFDLVLDIGCFHSITESSRPAYARGLGEHTRPGARYLLYAFQPRRFFLRQRMGLTRDEVETLFERWFQIRQVEGGTDPTGGGSAWYDLERSGA